MPTQQFEDQLKASVVHTFGPGRGLVLTLRQYLYTNVILYNLAMNIIKISFLLQYRRIFQSERLRKICLGAIAYVVVWGVVQEIISSLACLPISFIEPSSKAWCLDTLAIWYFSSAMSLATGFMIFLLPLPSVLALPLPRRQKILLLSIFLLGFL